MRCNRCGVYQEEKQSICPYCGTELLNLEQVKDAQTDQSLDAQSPHEDHGFSKENSEYIGARLMNEEEKPNDPPVKRINKKPFIILIIAAGMLMSVILLFHDMDNRGEEIDPEILLEIYSDAYKEQTIIFNGKGDVLFQIDQFLFLAEYNMKGTGAILLTYKMGLPGTPNELYYVDSEKLLLINQFISKFRISAEGNQIIYSRVESLGYSLHLFDVETGEDTVISTGSQPYEAFCISPDGNTVVYGEPYINSTGVEGFVISDIKRSTTPVSIGRDRFPLAVSDGGQYIYFTYYFNASPKYLFVLNQGEAHKMAEELTPHWMIFNRSYTEVLYNDGLEYYLWRNGHDKRKIADTNMGTFDISQNKDFMPSYGMLAFALSIDQAALTEICFMGMDMNIYWINGDYQTELVGNASMSRSFQPTKDGSRVLYFDKDNQLIKAIRGKDGYEDEIIASSADAFIAIKEQSEIYYQENDKLYYIDEKKQSKLLLQGVQSVHVSRNDDEVLAFVAGAGEYYELKRCAEGEVTSVGNIEGFTELVPMKWGTLLVRREEKETFYYYITMEGDFKELVIGQESKLLQKK